MIFRLTRRWQIMVVTCLLLTLQWGEKITIIARESCSTILDCRMLIKKEQKMFQTSSINAHGKLEPWRRLSRNWDILRWKNATEYRISSNNSRPSINRLRQINAPPPPLSQSSLPFIPSLTSWSAMRSCRTDRWPFKPWKLIKELN